MSHVGLLFLRFFLVVTGYAAAALAASAFLHFVAWPIFAIPGEEAPWILMGGLFLSVPVVAVFLSYFAFLPAAILVGLAEIQGYRGWLYHALSGAAAAFLALMIARRTQGAGIYAGDADGFHSRLPLMWVPEVATAVIAAGLVGGTVYWLIAGRTAGLVGRSHEDRLSG